MIYTELSSYSIYWHCSEIMLNETMLFEDMLYYEIYNPQKVSKDSNKLSNKQIKQEYAHTCTHSSILSW